MKQTAKVAKIHQFLTYIMYSDYIPMYEPHITGSCQDNLKLFLSKYHLHTYIQLYSLPPWQATGRRTPTLVYQPAGKSLLLRRTVCRYLGIPMGRRNIGSEDQAGPWIRIVDTCPFQQEKGVGRQIRVLHSFTHSITLPRTKKTEKRLPSKVSSILECVIIKPHGPSTCCDKPASRLPQSAAGGDMAHTNTEYLFISSSLKPISSASLPFSVILGGWLFQFIGVELREKLTR